nr:hypothetical protein [Tanacetum cinerariifolium]
MPSWQSHDMSLVEGTKRKIKVCDRLTWAPRSLDVYDDVLSSLTQQTQAPGCLTDETQEQRIQEPRIVQCRVNLNNGIYLNCTYGDGMPVTCCGCEGLLNGGFSSFCASRARNSFAYDPNPNSFVDSQNLSDYPPQPQYQTYSCELYGNDAHYGYDCPPQVPFDYN